MLTQNVPLYDHFICGSEHQWVLTHLTRRLGFESLFFSSFVSLGKALNIELQKLPSFYCRKRIPETNSSANKKKTFLILILNEGKKLNLKIERQRKNVEIKIAQCSMGLLPAV